MKLQIKRVYEAVSKHDGTRILVERLWPRGIKKENLKMDFWAKDVAPSTELRKWFSHDPAKWGEFQKRYLKELAANYEALMPIVEALHKGSVSLLYSAHDTEHNSALILKQYLEK